MKVAFQKLYSQVTELSDKFSDTKKRKEIQQAFELLAKELKQPRVQSQRVMTLLRMIITLQPGSSKAVNQFLKHPDVSQRMYSGGGFTTD